MGAIKKIEDNCKYLYSDYLQWDGDWEIIAGKAYSMSPSPSRIHQEIAGKIYSDFLNYLVGKSCKVYYELDVVLSDEDVVRPDIIVVCDKSKLSTNNIKGAPDLIIEILSPATSKMDKKVKLDLYKKYDVREYWIVDPIYKEITVNIYKENNIELYNIEDINENSTIPVSIFNNELKINLKYIFKED
jgi:Uma2 family endonuclease